MRKINWGSWKRVCRSKEDRGLGVKNVAYFNAALLTKWKFNLFSQSHTRTIKLFINLAA